MPYIVIDTCVAGAWLFVEPLSTAARPLLSAIQNRNVIAIVHDRFEEEVLRVCQKKVTYPGSTITAAVAFEQFLNLMTLPVPIYRLPVQELHEQSWTLATTTSGLTTHDALYVALAQRWDATLWTYDAKLIAASNHFGVAVKDLRCNAVNY